jgi:NADH/NAD ratio-sensing transcriptional regulator Rex
VRKNLRSWLVVIGVLSIVIACVIAYISTKPAEADVSMIFDIQPLFIGKSA